jgi:hypothetical protein
LGARPPKIIDSLRETQVLQLACDAHIFHGRSRAMGGTPPPHSRPDPTVHPVDQTVLAGACAALTSLREVYQWSVVYSLGSEPFALPRLLDWGVYTAQAGCAWCPKKAVQPKLRLAGIRVVGFSGLALTGEMAETTWPPSDQPLSAPIPMSTAPSTSPTGFENTTAEEQPDGGVDPMIYAAFCVVIVAQVRDALASLRIFRRHT